MAATGTTRDTVTPVADGQVRPVTRAQRGFGVEELAALNPLDLRRVCHGLLLGEGVTVQEYRRAADYEEFTAAVPGLWRAHPVIVRIFHREVLQADLDRAHSDAQASGVVEALVLAARSVDAAVVPPVGVHLVPPEELAFRITSSPLVEWSPGTPIPAVSRIKLFLDLAETTAMLDPVGLQWLPAVALNELPASLVSFDIEPQDLLERKAFRILTACFRFSGLRYGEAARGKRYPDAVLHWPDGSAKSAMVDCKAASSGYQMNADHLLRFIKYWDLLSPQLEKEGRTLSYLVVVSSNFPGAQGDRHPFYARAEEIRDKTGLQLAYVTASDLAWCAAQVESRDIQLPDRCRMDWSKVFDAGLVTADDFERALDEVA